MSAKLPKKLQEKIKELFRQGYSHIEVHNETISEATKDLLNRNLNVI